MNDDMRSVEIIIKVDGKILSAKRLERIVSFGDAMNFLEDNGYGFIKVSEDAT